MLVYSAARTCSDYVAAYGPASFESLVVEVITQTGATRENARVGVLGWTENLSVEVDEHGYWFIPGMGGCWDE